MGVAAYQRGTALIRRQMQRDFDDCATRRDYAHLRQLRRDASRLEDGIREMAERKHYFSAAEWYAEARAALARGRAYQALLMRVQRRIRIMERVLGEP